MSVLVHTRLYSLCNLPLAKTNQKQKVQWFNLFIEKFKHELYDLRKERERKLLYLPNSQMWIQFQPKY